MDSNERKYGIDTLERVINSLIPDETNRKQYLLVFLESLRRSHTYGSDMWGVYHTNEVIRLLVGGLIVLTIEKQGIWITLDQQHIYESPEELAVLQRSHDWHWDTGRWSQYTRIPSRNGFYTPSDRHLQIWPVIRQFHFSYIEKAAQKFTQLREDSQSKHMPIVLAYLRNTLHQYVPEPSYGGSEESPSDLIQDIEDFQSTHPDLPETERTAIVQSRVGQGRFRNDLIAYWGCCAVTRCQVLEILRASHIKPWRESTNAERLSVYNGLLLVPNLDAAFDRGFISFDDNGTIMISELLSDDERSKLRIHTDMKMTRIEKEHCGYLKYHREYVYKK